MVPSSLGSVLAQPLVVKLAQLAPAVHNTPPPVLTVLQNVSYLKLNRRCLFLRLQTRENQLAESVPKRKVPQHFEAIVNPPLQFWLWALRTERTLQSL